jgi:hypothetical protein
MCLNSLDGNSLLPSTVKIKNKKDKPIPFNAIADAFDT